MTFHAIIKKNFFYNFYKYISFYFVNSLICAMLFMYGSLMYNSAIIKGIGKTSTYGIVKLALVGIIIFSIVFITYTNIYFLKNRGKEFGVYLTLGMTYKDLTKMVIMENIGVMIASLVTGIVSGIVLGRMFYMVLNKMVSGANIQYTLNYKSFLLSASVFVIIFLGNVIFNIFYLRMISIVEGIKADVKKEIGHTNVFIGVVTILIFVAALYYLPIIILKGNIEDVAPIILGLFLVIIICPYIIIGAIITLIKAILKKFPNIYNKNLLVLSNLSHRFLAYKNILFITSLLLAGAMLFVGYSYSIYVSTREYISNENPYDIMFVESNKYNSVNREDVIDVVKDNGGSINEYKELEYIEVPVFKEESGNLSVLNTRHSVISQSNYNKHMGIDINIKPNEALYVTVENESKDYKIPNLIFLTLKDNNLEIVNKLSLNHGTLIEKEQFDELVKESHYLKINADKIKKEKGVQFTNFRYGGEYDSGFAFILNDNDYNMIKKNVKEGAIKNLHLMNVRNKDVAFTGLLNYLKGVNDLDSTYWNEGQLWGGKISEDERGTLEAYRPLYREELIRMQLDDNGMLLFTTIFIGILFIITNGVVLYYKVISDVNEERKRNSILFKVGILESEVKSVIKKELRIIFFVPIFIGGMLGVYFLYIMVFNSGMTELLMKKSIITLLLEILIQFIFYKISKNKYISEVNSV